MIALSFGGKRGDILWSLPTARELAKKYGPVDFYVMDHFNSVCELISIQPYINECSPLENWIVNPHEACQPWEAPVPKEYDQIFHLGYRWYPQEPLIHMALHHAPGIVLQEPVLPFLTVEPNYDFEIALGFSVYYHGPTLDGIMPNLFIDQYISKIKEVYPNISWINLSNVPLKEAAEYIAGAKLFLGDKSLLHVVAHGLDKFVIEAESNGERRAPTFCCPYNNKVFRAECTSILDVIDQYINVTLDQLSKYD